MGTQWQNNNGEFWLLPADTRKKKPVLEMGHSHYNMTTSTKEGESSTMNDVEKKEDLIGWQVFFSRPFESSEVIEANARSEKVFSLRSEQSEVNVFRHYPEDPNIKKDPEDKEEEGQLRSTSFTDSDEGLCVGAMNDDMLTRQGQSKHELGSQPEDKEEEGDLRSTSFTEADKRRVGAAMITGDLLMRLALLKRESVRKPEDKEEELMVQKHGPSKNFKLLKEAYGLINANNSIVSDNEIFKQRTPLGNTILHLAASRGDDKMVEKIAQQADPQLFTVVNNKNDTALHVAARTGHGSTIKLLLNKFLLFVRSNTNDHVDQSTLEMMLIVSLTLFPNEQGNTFLHEAFLTGSRNGAAIFEAFQAPFITDGGSDQFEDNFKGIVNHLAPFAVNSEGKSLLYLTVEAKCKHVVERLIGFCKEGRSKPHGKPHGKSPLLPALVNKDLDMLETILNNESDWIHLRDEQGRLPLHSAVFLGYLQGVLYLVEECPSCTMERDNKGHLPIHLACIEGHVKIVDELLKSCLDFAETVTDNGKNLLHLACKYGNYEVVMYLIKHAKLEIMINQKDNSGNTPLHLATKYWHPKIVHALTWDNRVKVSSLNHDNQTALDIAETHQSKNTSLSQRLTWIALVSAGTDRRVYARIDRIYQEFGSNYTESIGDWSETSTISTYKDSNETNTKDSNGTNTTAQFKDRIDTLIVISTLIITASFAAGFTIPGDLEQGIPVLLYHHMFHLFIFSITISVFGAISSTIILMWARLGDLNLAVFALTCAVPLLGLSLTTLSLAFLAGMYLIVREINWLAITFLLLGLVLILMVVFLYFLLFLPSTSSLPIFRYISYYPFLFFAMIAEGRKDANKKGSTAT